MGDPNESNAWREPRRVAPGARERQDLLALPAARPLSTFAAVVRGADSVDDARMHKRNYEAIAAAVSGTGAREARMRAVVDALWEHLKDRGVSWVGFYLPEGRDELVLGPMRDKPACSPIGLHGVCGQAFRQGVPQVVRDVAELGENYVACDPRDRSEVVVPLVDESGQCWAVLDLDSHDVGSFDDGDVQGLLRVLRAAELTV